VRRKKKGVHGPGEVSIALGWGFRLSTRNIGGKAGTGKNFYMVKPPEARTKEVDKAVVI